MKPQHLIAWRDGQSTEAPAKHETAILDPETVETARNGRLTLGEAAAALIVKQAFASHPHWRQHVGRRSLKIDILHPEAWMGAYVVPVLLNGDRPHTSAFRAGDVAQRKLEEVFPEIGPVAPVATFRPHLVAAE